VIVHLADGMEMNDWSLDIPKAAWRLAECYWPGPLTLILRHNGRALDVVTGGLPTVGLRVPGHPVALELLRQFGGAIAAPSANRFGRVSPTRAEHVREEFGNVLDIILDGGDCEVGLESTIVDLTGEQPRILRPGAITGEQVEAVCGQHLAAAGVDAPRCSGRLASHYAPAARVEIVAEGEVTEGEVAARAVALVAAGERVAVLSSTSLVSVAGATNFALSADLPALARELYRVLREVDRAGCTVALVTLPADEGLGAAIVDRLLKAAGPRE
jgi:L-threonylcarbamoyladenylate synthase